MKTHQITSHDMTWHLATNHITSPHVTSQPTAVLHRSLQPTTSKQVTTSPPWNGWRLVHSKNSVWASQWLVTLCTFYRQIRRPLCLAWGGGAREAWSMDCLPASSRPTVAGQFQWQHRIFSQPVHGARSTSACQRCFACIASRATSLQPWVASVAEGHQHQFDLAARLQPTSGSDVVLSLWS